MRIRSLGILAVLWTAVLLSACVSSRNPVPQIESADLLLTPNPDLQPTPTPFQPNPNSAAGSSNTDSQAGIGSASGLNPAYAHRTNILVLGSDWRPNSGYRTDVILLVSLDKLHGDVSVVSFPRDLWVQMPGMGEERINTAMEYGGFPLAKEMFRQNFDLELDHYIITNFQGFIALVNSLGGITVNAGRELSDTCSLPQAEGGYCYVGPGINTMDGQTALWYVRSRGTTSDFDRARRAQEVLRAILEKLSTQGLTEQPSQIFASLSAAVETDMKLDDLLPFLPLAAQVITNPSLVRQFFIGPTDTNGYVIPSTGANVLLPIPEAINSILSQAGGN